MYLVLIYTCFSSSNIIENGLGFLTVESKSHAPFWKLNFFCYGFKFHTEVNFISPLHNYTIRSNFSS